MDKPRNSNLARFSRVASLLKRAESLLAPLRHARWTFPRLEVRLLFVSLRRSAWSSWERLSRLPELLLTTLFFLLPFYPWGQRSAAPALLPSPPRRGDRHKGGEVLQGVCDWGGVRLFHPYPFWQPASASASWLEACHGFVWLDDVRAYAATVADTDKKLQAVRFVAERIDDWLLLHRRWSWESWSWESWKTATVAKRLTKWLQHYDWYAPALSAPQRLTLHRALYAHYRHLCRATHLQPRFSFERLTGLLVCATAALCFREGRARRQACERRLCRALEEQVPRGEGFWYGRRACLQQALMEALLQVKRLYALVQILPPEGMLAALDRMVPALMMLRCGDGALATFDGSGEGSASAVSRLLASVEVRARTPLSAAGAGLERMVSQKALVLVDTSVSRCSRALHKGGASGGASAYASTSAFEFCYEQDRLVVSCALEAAEQASLSDLPSQRAARSSAAHSMLTLGERNVCSLHPFDGHRVQVNVARSMLDGETRLALSHDGYRGLFGMAVSRELHLSRVGTNLWGWERLRVEHRRRFERSFARGLPFALRFHLHPKVSVFLLRHGREAVLKPDNRPGFRFRLQGAASLSVADSLYGGEGRLTPTKQLLVSGILDKKQPDDSFLLAWHLQHEVDEEA